IGKFRIPLNLIRVGPVITTGARPRRSSFLCKARRELQRLVVPNARRTTTHCAKTDPACGLRSNAVCVSGGNRPRGLRREQDELARISARSLASSGAPVIRNLGTSGSLRHSAEEPLMSQKLQSLSESAQVDQ